MSKKTVAAPPALATEMVPIDSVVLDPANVRRHPDRNLETIKGSLARFGQQRPILVDSKGVVRAGNGTLAAARALGWPEIVVVRSDLTGSEMTAYALVDNRSAETAEWNYEGLGETIRALQEEEFDISVLGWQDHELEPILAADWEPPSAEELPAADGDGKDANPEDDPGVIVVTPEQRLTIDRAILRVRTTHGDMTLTEGWCVGRVCDEFLREAP